MPIIISIFSLQSLPIKNDYLKRLTYLISDDFFPRTNEKNHPRSKTPYAYRVFDDKQDLPT